MEAKRKKNLILSAVVLLLAFLIESPLHIKIQVLFSFSALGSLIVYALLSLICYIAIIVCLLFTLEDKPQFSDFLKASVSVLALFIVDKLISFALSIQIIVLVYQVIRPAVTFAFIYLAVKWMGKCEFKKTKMLLVIGVVVFVISIVLNVYGHVLFLIAVSDTQNQFYSYLDLLSASDEGYNMWASLCRYILIFIPLCAIKLKNYTQIEETAS
ncbi:MAG: hypothetical protein IJZ75_05650 [Clostridia bacterium]|nr:hypothetical protein [Clostridia bacterium]